MLKRETEIYIVTQWAVDVRSAAGWQEIAAVTRFRVATQLAAGLLSDGRSVRVRDLTTGRVAYSVEL